MRSWVCLRWEKKMFCGNWRHKLILKRSQSEIDIFYVLFFLASGKELNCSANYYDLYIHNLQLYKSIFDMNHRLLSFNNILKYHLNNSSIKLINKLPFFHFFFRRKTNQYLANSHFKSSINNGNNDNERKVSRLFWKLFNF